VRHRTPFNAHFDFYVGLLPGESVTSWLVRLARANAIGLHELASRVQSQTMHSTTMADLDVLRNDRFSRLLASATGVAWEDIELACLANWRWLLSAETSTHKWVLSPSKSRGGARQGRWSQACFACLAQDETPFFRLYWRFAFVTECEVHHSCLVDECPRCGGPLDYPRLDRGGALHRRLLPLSTCPRCLVDWRIYGLRLRRSDPRILTLQRLVLTGLSQRWVIGLGSPIWTGVVLDGIYRLIRCFRSNHGSRVASRLCREHVPAGASEPIEGLPTIERRILLLAVASALSGWPAAFVQSAVLEKLTATGLRERGVAPWWLERVVAEYLDRTWYAPSKIEEANARDVLSRHGINATPWVLREWLGGYVPKRRLGALPGSTTKPLQLSLWRYPDEVRDAIRARYVRMIPKLLREYCMRLNAGRVGSKQIQLVMNF
jgi:hypothetical protein